MLNGKSFHVTFWDEGTVVGATRLASVKKKSIEDFANFIVAHPPEGWQTQGDPETWPAQWASEILPLANTALTKVDIGEGTPAENQERTLQCTWPVTISRDYSTWANKQALNQLGKAGFRLAALVRTVMQGN